MTGKKYTAEKQLAVFWDKTIPEPNSGCILWTAGTTFGGYGVFRVHGRLKRAHIFSYELVHGSVPDGMQLDHKCRVPCCVNPGHLEAVTQRENILRGTAPPAINARMTVCINGHEFTTENTHIFYESNGKVHRRCKICLRQYQNERYRKQHERLLAETRA